MRIMITAALALSLCGCTALNPAPYDPTTSAASPTTPISTSFSNFSTAAISLESLAGAYKATRNDLIYEKPFFDLPAVALGVANAAFDGARAATVALGLSAATAYGVSSYFGIETRITAYTTAADSFNCATDTADQMKLFQEPTDPLTTPF